MGEDAPCAAKVGGYDVASVAIRTVSCIGGFA
jgi:hypothetical protein